MSPGIRFARDGGSVILSTQRDLDSEVHAVFAFFADAQNLERLTPPTLRFQVTTRDIVMERGALIEYRLRLRGVPIRWRTEITRWDPPHGFVDKQVRGPYLSWEHEHRFEPLAGGRTRMIDTVRYRPPGGRVTNGLFVRRELTGIFRYRGAQVDARFGPARI